MKEIGNTNWASDPITEKDVTLDIPFQVDREGDLPLHLQVKRNISNLILQGYWQRGEKLPTERELASALGVSRNTVSRDVALLYQNLAIYETLKIKKTD